ncbi:MAG: DUF21 domain-containing protein, partial [Clostridia bacterium]|nr:DUF21 domain-containing protein [Clostridia bacterium]
MLIAIFVIFVILGGYFACAESCFSAVNKIRIKTLADNVNRRAKKAMKIIDDFDRALTALLIGNNITHIAAASIAVLYVTRVWGNSDTVTLICTFVTTGIVFFFSEMIPKSLANDRSETMALVCSGSLVILMKILTPFVAFFSAVSNLFAKIFKKKIEPSITEDELVEIIENAEEQGVVDEEQSDLLKSVLDFDDTKAEDVMTMRDDIAFLDISLTNKEIVEKLKTIPHSRIPVVDGSLDNIIGILPIRKFLKEYMVNKRADVRSVL